MADLAALLAPAGMAHMQAGATERGRENSMVHRSAAE